MEKAKDTVKEEVKKQVREGRIYSWESRRTMHFEAQVNAESGIAVGFKEKGFTDRKCSIKSIVIVNARYFPYHDLFF